MSNAAPGDSQAGAVVMNGTLTKWALGLIGAVMLSLLGAVIGTVQQHGTDIRKLREFMAETRSNRFTDEDGAQLYRELVRYHEARTPPPEVVQRLDALERRLDRLEEQHGPGSSGGGDPY